MSEKEVNYDCPNCGGCAWGFVGQDAYCENCKTTYETDYEKHDEIPPPNLEYWIVKEKDLLKK